jgi:hypothetical protein
MGADVLPKHFSVCQFHGNLRLADMSKDAKLTLLILLWVLDKLFMALMFWILT